MPFPFDKYPWVNFHELNLAYFIKHFREIFQQWNELYNGMLEWKADTEEELETWKNGVMDAIDNWEHDFSAAMEVWKQETETDLANWETSTLAALDAWKTAAEAAFEVIRVQAAGSASAAAQSAADADTARAAAVTAQAAAEAAAAGISSSLTQIQTNTSDIAALQALKGFELSSTKPATIPDNSDFNDLRSPGTYKVTSNTHAQTMTNIPVNNAGKLIVNELSHTSKILQWYFTSNSSTNCAIYHRYWDGANWGSWDYIVKSPAFTALRDRVDADETAISNLAVEIAGLQDTGMIVHGDITALGYTSLAECTSPGIYTFATAHIANISDMPSYIKAGGFYILYSSARQYSELVSTAYRFIRYGQGAWNDVYKYIHLSYEAGSGADDSTERVNIDIPNINVNGSYFRYKMGHCVNTGVNGNVWRLIGIYDYRDLGTGVTPTETTLTSRGEFECAVHLADRSDFSGGIVHGDEIDNSIRFIIDGKNTAVSGIASTPFCKEIRIVRNSNLYDPADHTTIIAKHGIEYVYSAEGLRIHQSVKWLGSYSLTQCYLAMLPILKTYTPYRYDDIDFTVTSNPTTPDFDISIPGAKAVAEFGNNYFAKLSVARYPEGLTGGDRAIITDNTNRDYNKVYFVVCASGSVTNGTLWQADASYDIR